MAAMVHVSKYRARPNQRNHPGNMLFHNHEFTTVTHVTHNHAKIALLVATVFTSCIVILL